MRAGQCILQPQCCRANAYTSTQQSKKACPNSQMLDQVLEAVGATAQPGPENVDAFLLPNAPQPRKSVLLNVALSGSVLFSPSSVVLGTGPRVGYHRALSRRRTVWFSEEFLHLHPKLARVFLSRMGASSHRWSVVTDRETFAQRAKGKKRAKTRCLGFVQTADAC
jgi:uncharacterized protein YfiM (DUF2279 family)